MAGIPDIKRLQESLNEGRPPFPEASSKQFWQPSMRLHFGEIIYPLLGMEPVSREADFQAWLLWQSDILQARLYNLVDYEQLAEELQEMAQLARSEVVSRLRLILAHLLKWKYQSQYQNNSWKVTLIRERQTLGNLLADSKNLRNYTERTGFALAYQQARALAAAEMGISDRERDGLFPADCEWSLSETLQADFYPSAHVSD